MTLRHSPPQRYARAVASMALLWAGIAGALPLPRFPAGAVWNEDVSAAPLHPDSAAMIATLGSLGGFGNGRMQIDFGMHVIHAAADAPTRVISGYPYDSYYTPDCEPIGTALPVPIDAAIEGQAGLSCDNRNEDCHLLVVQGGLLYEAYHANVRRAGELEAQCLAIWDLSGVYPPEGRGDHCTSADAAGFPIAPLLFNADEIAGSLAADPTGNGDLGHAIRFILPNARMASDDALGGVDGRLYVRPASHAGAPSGPVETLAYGARLRLRADFPLDAYNPAARVILNTFKRYGIVLADGGTLALTAESDRYTATKWADLGIDARVFDLTAGARDVQSDDFEVVDTGPRIAETYECERNGGPVDPPGWESVYSELVGDTAQLALLRVYRDQVLQTDPRGEIYTRLLYRWSESALATLEHHPALLQEAAALIDLHHHALAQVTAGGEGTIDDSERVARLLLDFGQVAPRGLRLLARQVVDDLRAQRGAGRRFLGLRLR